MTSFMQTEVMTIEALRRAVDSMNENYRPAQVDGSYAMYMREAMFLMLRRSRSWFLIADRRAKEKAARRSLTRRSRSSGRINLQ